MKTEGPLTLYKGLSSGLIGVVLSFATYFYWYRLLKNFWYRVLGREELGDLDISLITFLSGMINAFLTNPIWLLNTRMSLAPKGDQKTMFETIKDIYHQEGLLAFYKGVLPNMWLIINPIINFVVYENLKRTLLNRGLGLSTLQLILLNSLSKFLATVATYPLLTARVRL